MTDPDIEDGTVPTRRERAVQFVDSYIDKYRDLFDKLARE